jgi:hypothetical protein
MESVESPKKNIAPRDRRWRSGQSGNPNGRPVVSRNRFSENFVSDVAKVWDEHGASVLERMVRDEPARAVRATDRGTKKGFSRSDIAGRVHA